MATFAQELVSVDRERLDLRAGLVGLGVVGVLAALIAIFGPEAMAGVIGALVVLSTDPPPAGRRWAAALLPLVLVGTVLTYAAVSIGDRAVWAAVLVGVVGVAGALHAGRSRRAGIRALVTTIWVIVALTLADTPVDAVTYAVAFAIGGVVGALVALLRARREGSSAETDDDVEPVTSSTSGATTGTVRTFAVLRGAGLALAVFIGFTWFPEHAAWVAISALLVMRPPTQGALVVGLQRSLGTAAGVTIAVLLASVVGENKPVLVLLFLASAFLMMAAREVNYALFAALVTTLVVYLQRILGADASESGAARFVETVIGVAIAFVVLGATEALSRTRSTDA